MPAPTLVKDGKAILRDGDGNFYRTDPSAAQAKIDSGDRFAVSEKDFADFERKKANDTAGGKARAFLGSAGAAALDTLQAPVAAPVRLGAAALGLGDPLKGTSGPETIENLATLWGDIKESRQPGPAPGTSSGPTGEAYGREFGEKQRELQEQHEGYTTAGQFAGAMLGGAPLSGGAGALGAGLTARLGGGLGARVAGTLTRGAIEGALFGETGAVEEAYQHNMPLTGEKLVASMGLGAILGGGVSMASEGLGAALKRGLSREGGSAARAAEGGLAGAAEATEGGAVTGALRDFADQRTARALGADASMAKKLGRTAEQFEAETKELSKAIRNMKLEDGTDVFQAVQSKGGLGDRIAAKIEELDTKLESFRGKAAELAEAHPEIAASPENAANRVRAEISDKLAKHPDSVTASMAQPVEQLASDLDAIAAKPGKSKLADLTELQGGLDERIAQMKAGVDLGPPARVQDLEKVRGIIASEIEASTDKATQFMDDGAAKAYRQAKNERRMLDLAEGISANAGNDLGSVVSDYGAAAVGALASGGLGGLATGLANKVVREHASSAMAVLADRLANTLDGKIEQGLGSFFREASQRATAGADSAGKVAGAVPIKRASTPLAVDAFIGRSKDLESAYEKRSRELVDATANAGAGARAQVQAAMGPAYESNPKLTQAATMATIRGADYLRSQLPSGTKAPTVFQPSRTLPPSELEMQVFAQKWGAVANPLSVIDDLRRGTVTHAQIDAIKAVYPELYAQVQQKTMEGIIRLDQQGKRMPFDDRLQLDLFLDLNGAGEPTLAGPFIDRLSALLAAQDAKKPKPAPSASSMNKLASSAVPASESVLNGGGS